MTCRLLKVVLSKHNFFTTFFKQISLRELTTECLKQNRSDFAYDNFIRMNLSSSNTFLCKFFQIYPFKKKWCTFAPFL